MQESDSSPLPTFQESTSLVQLLQRENDLTEDDQSECAAIFANYEGENYCCDDSDTMLQEFMAALQ